MRVGAAAAAAAVWLAAAVLAGGGSAAAQQPVPKDLGGGSAGPAAGASAAARAVAALPAELSGMRRVGEVTDFEARPGGAGLGASARCVPASGERIVATVYIYDRGRAGLPEGAAGPAVEQELRATAAELDAAVRLGRYRSAAEEAGVSVGPTAGGPPALRRATWRLVQPDGAGTGDAACVTVRRGAFVKVRLTAWSVPEPAAAGVMAAAALEARGGGAPSASGSEAPGGSRSRAPADARSGPALP